MTKLSRMQRLRLRKSLLKERDVEDVSREAMDALAEYMEHAIAGEIPAEQIISLRLHLGLILEYADLDAETIAEIEDSILIKKRDERV